jgi:hypothetical protein
LRPAPAYERDGAEQKNQRHHEAKEKEGAIPHREAYAHFRKRPGATQGFGSFSIPATAGR